MVTARHPRRRRSSYSRSRAVRYVSERTAMLDR